MAEPQSTGPLFGVIQYDAENSPISVISADLDGVNGVDIATLAGSFPPEVCVFLNNGDGLFADPGTYSVGTDPKFFAAGG